MSRFYSLHQETKQLQKYVQSIVLEELGEKVIAIYPVYKYEHGGIVFRVGSQFGFDYSNNGFYIVTEATQKLVGTKKKKFSYADFKAELEEYTKWCNGEVYGYMLYDDKGEMVDSCWGFYDIEDIRGNLPEEWKDENLQDYVTF